MIPTAYKYSRILSMLLLNIHEFISPQWLLMIFFTNNHSHWYLLLIHNYDSYPHCCWIFIERGRGSKATERGGDGRGRDFNMHVAVTTIFMTSLRSIHLAFQRSPVWIKMSCTIAVFGTAMRTRFPNGFDSLSSLSQSWDDFLTRLDLQETSFVLSLLFLLTEFLH